MLEEFMNNCRIVDIFGLFVDFFEFKGENLFCFCVYWNVVRVIKDFDEEVFVIFVDLFCELI